MSLSNVKNVTRQQRGEIVFHFVIFLVFLLYLVFIYVMAAGCGPLIPVSTFVLAGVRIRPVYVSGCYSDSVWDGDEYYFYFRVDMH